MSLTQADASAKARNMAGFEVGKTAAIESNTMNGYKNAAELFDALVAESDMPFTASEAMDIAKEYGFNLSREQAEETVCSYFGSDATL